MPRWWWIGLLCAGTPTAIAATLAPDVAPFVTTSAPSIALRHVNVIDGSGAAARADQTVVIVNGRVAAVGPVCRRRFGQALG